MKISKILVGKGCTRKTEGRWEKEYYEVTCVMEFDEEVNASKDKVLDTIEEWLLEKPQSVNEQAIKRVRDPCSFENLPWKTFQTKQLCKPREAGWTFRDARGAEELVDQLDKSGMAWTTIHDMEYRLSGNNYKLIQRRPVKK